MECTRRDLMRLAVLAAGASAVAACAPLRPAPPPPPEPPPWPETPALRVRYGAGHAHQFGDLRCPLGPGPHPLVVVVHGGFWLAAYDLQLLRPLCDALCASGYATWNIEYRRIGDAGGGWPGTFLDVAAAADHVRGLASAHHLDLRQVTSLGHSAGGHLALWLAARRWLREGELARRSPLALKRAVALAGIGDLRRAWEMGFEVVGQLLGGAPDDFQDIVAAVEARHDVHVEDLVRALGVVAPGEGPRVADHAQALQADALDQVGALDVEPRDQACRRHLSRR